MVSEHRSEGGGTAAHPNTTGESVGPSRGEAVAEHDDCEWEAQGKQAWYGRCVRVRMRMRMRIRMERMN